MLVSSSYFEIFTNLILELDAVERFIDEMTAPTPPGQEPKSVSLVKSITWFAVIVLVLLEIVVSVKSGGLPFELSKVQLTPSPMEQLNNMDK